MNFMKLVKLAESFHRNNYCLVLKNRYNINLIRQTKKVTKNTNASNTTYNGKISKSNTRTFHLFCNHVRSVLKKFELTETEFV